MNAREMLADMDNGDLVLLALAVLLGATWGDHAGDHMALVRELRGRAIGPAPDENNK